jgi:hypothetical protein
MDFNRIIDRVQEWWRYPQPTKLQKQLLGQFTDVIDTDITATRLASEESARYVIKHMRTVPNFANDYDFHDWILRNQVNQQLVSSGLILEFGVATGRTLNHIGRIFSNKTVHGFDSFEGLPENWTSRMPAGFFARSSLPSVRKNCELHVGWFDNTLPKFLSTNEKLPIALLHVDSDLYSSAKTILTLLNSQLVKDTVIIFDEYINYPGWELDEFRAWQEFVNDNNITYEYIGRVSSHQKVAVRIVNR